MQAGADAIYIGPPAFGARQAAGNSLEDLEEVVRYAHSYGVQVLVTLNTLLRDDEYPQAVALAHALYKIGVDALIIQDLHLLDFDLERFAELINDRMKGYNQFVCVGPYFGFQEKDKRMEDLYLLLYKTIGVLWLYIRVNVIEGWLLWLKNGSG